MLAKVLLRHLASVGVMLLVGAKLAATCDDVGSQQGHMYARMVDFFVIDFKVRRDNTCT